MLGSGEIALIHKIQEAARDAIADYEKQLGGGLVGTMEEYQFVVGSISAYRQFDDQLQQMIRRDKDQEFQDDDEDEGS